MPSSLKYRQLLLVMVVAALVHGCAGSDDPAEPVDGSSDESATSSGPTPDSGWIFDHTHSDLSRVPQQWITTAKQNLRIAYGHTSHGSQIVTGMEALQRVLGAPYGFDLHWGYHGGAFFNDGGFEGADDLGSPDRRAWSSATRRLFQRNGGCDRNVVMWSWCGQVDGTQAEIQSYLDQMATLERDFPDTRFVYMTGHLDGSGENGNVHRRNEQIRAFCRNNGKVLFDFADIESWDPDGDTYYLPLHADDGCNYDGGNWADEWLSAHPGSELATLARACDDCAHSETLNCVLKGRVFWWMAARLAGWEGV